MPKPTYQTTGLVIGRTNFGEADRVVRFLTPEHGQLSAVAKGVRRIKSRAGGHLELFGEVSLTLATGRNLDVVTSARLLWYPHTLVGAYERLGLAFALATAVARLTEPRQPVPAVYNLTREALSALDSGAGGPLPELWFKLRLATILGYRPQLADCATCAEHSSADSYTFSPERGGIMCPTHTSSLDAPISPAQIKFWRLLCDHSYGTVSQITGADELAAATLRLCDAFYLHHLGSAFKPTLTIDTV